MSAKRLYICLIGFLLFLTIEPVQSQDSIGVNLVKQQVDKVIKGDKKSRFFNHIGYRRIAYADDEDQLLLKYGFEGFEKGKWRFGANFGLGDVNQSISVNGRALHRTFRYLDLYAELGVEGVKGYGISPILSGGFILFDLVDVSAGLIYDHNANKVVHHTGFGINIHSVKKSLIVHGAAIVTGGVLFVMLARAIGRSM